MASNVAKIASSARSLTISLSLRVAGPLELKRMYVCMYEFAPDVDKICQWQNGIIQMDHITPHTSQVKFGQFRFVFNHCH